MYLIVLAPMFAIFYYVNDKLQKNYPKQYSDFLLSLSFNIIYYGSTAQNMLQKCYNRLCIAYENAYQKIVDVYPEIDDYKNSIISFFNKNKNKNFIEFILNGEVIYFINKDDYLINKNNIVRDNFDFDFAIYSEFKKKNNDYIINKRIIKNFPEKEDLTCNETIYKFILVELKIQDEKIRIDFLIQKNNFYIVNNEIDYKFIHYLLNTYYYEQVKKFNINMSIDMKINNFNDYVLQICDQNIDIVNFDNTNKLIFKENGYEVTPYINDTDSESDIDSDFNNEEKGYDNCDVFNVNGSIVVEE
jgi:hypothetical protein